MLNKLISWIWINHPRLGTPDAMLTLAVIATLTVLGKFLLAGIVLTYGDKSITLGTIDALTVGAILTPTLGAYVARKYSNPPDGK